MKIRLTALVSTAVLALGLAHNAAAEKMTSIGITTIVEVPALLDVKNGVVKALADAGYVEGKNLKIDYQNAQGNMPTQQQIARKFAGDEHDLIVSITTPSSQAVYASAKGIPIVFTAVTDPVKAKLIPQFMKPGGNITGVSDMAPIGHQLDLIKEILPNVKTLGFIYNPGLDNAVAALEAVRAEGEKRGLSVVESPAPTTNEVIAATRKLIGKVDAVYIPNDTTVVSALESIIKIAQEIDLPLFAGETGAVERGVIASIGYNYFELGEISGRMAARVLKGEKPGDIDSVRAFDVSEKLNIYINKTAAKEMGVTISDATLKKAAKTF